LSIEILKNQQRTLLKQQVIWWRERDSNPT